MSGDKMAEAESQIKADDHAMAELERQNKQTVKEVSEYYKNRSFGVKPHMLEAFCGVHKWKINPKGHTRTVRNKLMGIVDNYTEQLTVRKERNNGSTLAGSSADIKIYEDATRDMLSLALVGFTNEEYDKLADDEDVGPALLGHLAVELKVFLVDNGGKAAAQHSLMQQALAQLTGFSGTTEQ